MSRSSKDRLFEVADRQQGYFTSQQAEECGFYRSHFRRFIVSGEWVKEIRGVYRLVRYPVHDRSELVLWTLWSRNKQGEPQGVWSHQTALDIYELSDLMPAKMHMTVPTGFRRGSAIPAVLCLHYADLESSAVEKRRGYWVTSALQTLMDLANEGRVSPDLIAQGLVQALERGLVSRRDLNELDKDVKGPLTWIRDVYKI